MKNKFDVIIIGAGPAGLKCAESLKDTALQILIIEKNKTIGPKICGGGITGLVCDSDIPLDKARAFDLQVVVLNGREHFMKLINPIYTIDRIDLAQYQLAKIKKSKNIIILTQVNVKEIGSDFVKTNKGDFYFKNLVASDGADSVLRSKLGLETNFRFGICCDVPVRAASDTLIWHFEPKLLKSGYIWEFPHKDHLNVGIYYNQKILPHAKAKQILNDYLVSKGYNKHTKLSGAPVGCCYRGCVFGNTYLAGDAAGLASKMTGEGIPYALTSGDEIAKKILDAEYKMYSLRKILIVKWIQKALLKVFVWFNCAPFMQIFFFWILIVFLRFRWFQYVFGNRDYSGKKA